MRLLSIVLVAACGGSSTPGVGSSGSGSGSGSLTATTSGSATAISAGSGSAITAAPTDAAVAAAVDAGPAPLLPKVHEARCDEPCLFLVDTPIGDLDKAFTTACPGKRAPDLGFEDCKGLDYVRNCIYAAHGVAYKQKKWKAIFANKAWYTPDPAIAVKTALGAVELANVHELRERGKACKKGIQISGGDYDRLKAWFGAFPGKVDLPVITFSDGESIEHHAFVIKVQEALGTGKIALTGKVSAMYMGDDLHYTGADFPSDDMPDTMVTAIKAPDEKKLRAIRVAFPDPDDKQQGGEFTGTHVFFIYDDKDKLRGVEVRPFGYPVGE
nr:YARHG domain-containing protein [Kofleriaceae bacterium]